MADGDDLEDCFGRDYETMISAMHFEPYTDTPEKALWRSVFLVGLRDAAYAIDALPRFKSHIAQYQRDQERSKAIDDTKAYNTAYMRERRTTNKMKATATSLDWLTSSSVAVGSFLWCCDILKIEDPYAVRRLLMVEEMRHRFKHMTSAGKKIG